MTGRKLVHTHAHTCTFKFHSLFQPKAAAAKAVKKDGPTIFIFIVGGVTYSEMRAINEVCVCVCVFVRERNCPVSLLHVV